MNTNLPIVTKVDVEAHFIAILIFYLIPVEYLTPLLVQRIDS